MLPQRPGYPPPPPPRVPASALPVPEGWAPPEAGAVRRVKERGQTSLSPVWLPWWTLKLMVRFAVPLALWYSVGELLRYGIMYAGYKGGLRHSAVPVAALSLMVMVQLGVTLAMMFSVREGLRAIQERDGSGNLAPWALGDEEGILGALGRALLPFMIFYLAWGWYSQDAKDFIDAAVGWGFATGGLSGQLQGLGLLLTLDKHPQIAIGLVVVFFLLKFVGERWIMPKLPRVGGIFVAYTEVNWTLFGIFTVDHLRGAASGWIGGRIVWHWIASPFGGFFAKLFHPVIEYWPLFKDAVLGSLVWLVIAGVILGVDAMDEEAIMGRGRAGRRLARVAGLHKEHKPHEVLTRDLRDKWLPTWFGLRLVKRSGLTAFAVLCVLYSMLYVGEDLARRGAYYLIGAHPIDFWVTRMYPVGFVVGMVFQMARICLLAAAFNLVMARVSARNRAARASVSAPAAAPAAASSST
jgi:hypothetical protein